MPHFSHQRYRLEPAETLFDPLPLLLADSVSRMPRRPFIDGACRHPFLPRELLKHHQRCISFCRPVGLEQFRRNDQPFAVLNQQVAVVAQFGLLAVALTHQQCVRIGRRFMRLVRTLLAVKIHCWIAWIIGRHLLAVLRLKALQTGPGFYQRTVRPKHSSSQMLLARCFQGICKYRLIQRRRARYGRPRSLDQEPENDATLSEQGRGSDPGDSLHKERKQQPGAADGQIAEAAHEQ